MVAIKTKPRKRAPVQAVITDREAMRLIVEEAAKLGEARATVATRCIIRYFATREMRPIPVSGTVS